MSGRGRFVVLDGIDGCGKSTQAARLVAWLEERGERPLHLREPGSTALGERLRAVLLDRDLDIAPGPEALLFCAARAQMLGELVAPALADGRAVVCERFHPSTYAYQAVAGELDPERVLALLETWAGDPRPDVALVLDLDPEVAARRVRGGGDRIEDKGLEFQRRVAAGFRRAAERIPGVRLVDASGDPDAVFARILAEVEHAAGAAARNG